MFTHSISIITVILLVVLVCITCSFIKTGIQDRDIFALGAASIFITIIILIARWHINTDSAYEEYITDLSNKIQSNEYQIYYDNVLISANDITDIEKYKAEVFDDSHKIVLH